MNSQSTSLPTVPQLPTEPAKELVPAAETIVPPQAPAKKDRIRRVLLAGAAVALLATASWYGSDYWTIGRFLVSTDDAYVKADNTTIAPKVSGYLNQVLVADNERVKSGQVLARIDDRDFKVALDQAKADVAAAQAAVESKRAQLDVQQAVIASARATLDVDTAAQVFTAQENKRYTDLSATGYGSVQNAQNAQARDTSALAAIARDKANLASAQKQVELLKAELTQAVATAAKANAMERQAELNLSYTTIISPIDGVANYKETQLSDVRPGQPVDIEVDMFPGKAVHGHVDSLAPASGQEFALLPPDNATGNFTKVVQRIPVKIALDSFDVDLRPGMSVIPSIQTKGAIAAAPQPSPANPAVAQLASQR
jgi:membrane fusion protein (multidrug efflux system)